MADLYVQLNGLAEYLDINYTGRWGDRQPEECFSYTW